jgi:hypothetical protein
MPRAVEGVEGNGGQMARTSKSRAKAPEPEPEPVVRLDETNPEQEGAYKILRRDVGRTVRKNSTKIAESLVKSALEGNSNSARLLVSLVNRKKNKKTPVKTRHGPSVAMNLAEEPQWKGEENGPSTPARDKRQKERDTDETH